jgi:hypothetical protein
MVFDILGVGGGAKLGDERFGHATATVMECIKRKIIPALLNYVLDAGVGEEGDEHLIQGYA